MSEEYVEIVKQGLDLGNPYGMPSIEIRSLEEGVKLTQSPSLNPRRIYIDNDSIIPLIASLIKALVANGANKHRVWMRLHRQAR